MWSEWCPLSSLEDPRRAETIKHCLLDILAIAICAVICGAESWTDIEEYGKAKQVWLATVLRLPNGIPSPDTVYLYPCVRST